MPDHPGGLTRDHVVWAYRLLLDRDPENEDVIGPKLAGSRDTTELRGHLMTSAEFQEKNRDYAHTNDRTLVIKELDGGVRLFVDLSDHVIGLNIVRGRYEAEEIDFARSGLKPGDTAVDVGAARRIVCARHPSAGALHQDGRGRRGAASGPRRDADPERGSAGDSVRVASHSARSRLGRDRRPVPRANPRARVSRANNRR